MRGLFEEALRRDPGSGEVRIQLSWWHFWDVWTKRRDTSGLRITEKLAREAALIDRRDARAQLPIGLALMIMGQPEEARIHFNDAITLNPSLAAAHACLGTNYIFRAGEGERSASSPFAAARSERPIPVSFSRRIGGRLLHAGRLGQGMRICRTRLQVRPGYWYSKAILIASLARSGQMRKALEIRDKLPVQLRSANQLAALLDRKWNDHITEGLSLVAARFRRQLLAGLSWKSTQG